MPDSLHSYKQEGMAYPGDPSEDHLRYDGCSLNLLKAPDNSCHYVACYGKDNNVECGTHKLYRLKGEERRVKQKKVKQEPSKRVSTQLSRDKRIEEEEILTEEEDLLIEEEDILE